MTERKFSEALCVKELLPYIEEAIKDDGMFTLYPSGQSMLPTIVEKKDCVVLKKAQNLKKYDIVLYRRCGGKFVLHRIICLNNGNYIMCGDNQYRLEEGIFESDIVAVVDEIRKGNGTVLTRKMISDRKVGTFLFFKRLYLSARGTLARVYRAVFKMKRR